MYECEQCGYNTESKARFNRHLNRKTNCAPKPHKEMTSKPYITVNDDTITTVVNNVTTTTTINNKIRLKFGNLIVDLEDVKNPVIRERIKTFVDDMMIKYQLRKIIENNFSNFSNGGDQSFEMNFD